MAPVLPLRTAWIADILSQASLRDVERQRCWKRGSGDEQGLWDYFTARLSDLSMPLTSEVRRSPEPSARPSAAAANLYDVLIRGERWIVLMLSPIVRDVQRQRCWKRGSGDGQRLTRLSDRSMPLKGEVRRSPEQSARQPIARSDKFVRHAYLRRVLGCENTTVLCFLPSWSTLLFERRLGERGDLTCYPAVKHQSPAAKTTNSNYCNRAVAQVKQHM